VLLSFEGWLGGELNVLLLNCRIKVAGEMVFCFSDCWLKSSLFCVVNYKNLCIYKNIDGLNALNTINYCNYLLD
jgi:hypothetical protein